MSDGRVSFRRINGRIIPIRTGKALAGGVVATAVAYRVSKKSKSSNAEPNRFMQAAAIGLNVISGIVSARPSKGARGFIKSQGLSFGLDSIGTSLNAKSVQGIKGSRTRKLKEFAKAEFRSQVVGYGVFGASLLSNKAFRDGALKFAGRALRKSTKLLRYGI